MANTVFNTAHEIFIYHRNETFPVLEHTQHDSTQPKAREESLEGEQMVLIYERYLTTENNKKYVSLHLLHAEWNLKIKFQNVSWFLIIIRISGHGGIIPEDIWSKIQSYTRISSFT